MLFYYYFVFPLHKPLQAAWRRVRIRGPRLRVGSDEKEGEDGRPVIPARLQRVSRCSSLSRRLPVFRTRTGFRPDADAPIARGKTQRGMSASLERFKEESRMFALTVFFTTNLGIFSMFVEQCCRRCAFGRNLLSSAPQTPRASACGSSGGRSSQQTMQSSTTVSG